MNVVHMNVTVAHPHLPGTTRTVPAADVPRWTAQGWLAPDTWALVGEKGPELLTPELARRLTTTKKRRRRSTPPTTGSES